LSYKTFRYSQPFTLESGKTLPGFHLAYTTYGKLNAAGDNAVWIFHALTASSQAEDWWPGLVGEDKLFDPKEYFVVCVNIPGSCYGSIGPLDINPLSGEPYYHDFPLFTTRDMVRAYKPLREALGIRRIFLGTGGSMGGQQLLEWAIEEPLLFEHIIPIAANAQHSSWGIAFNASQRWCITSDAGWPEKKDTAGIQGMKVARSIALLSYRGYETYSSAQLFKSESYQHYQGEKLGKRFNAFSYYFLTKAMDVHNVSRARGAMKEVLKIIQARTLVIGIATDILFPPREQEFLAEHIQGAELAVIDSLYGHDGFLLEYEKITQVIRRFIGREKNKEHKQVPLIY
jgi:homoserine O-acetyltransferase